jgi:methylmalonyl-CoA/ethylmalonyl-CoA epimerase
MPDTRVPDRSDALEVVRIHHVGIIVRDAEEAAETYRRGLGLDPLAVEDYQGVARVAFLRAGETLVELIEPLRVDSLWAAALRTQGEGPHHVALEVVDLRAALAALAASGVGLLDARPRRDAGDVLSVFLDPAATGGTLIELVQQIRT